MSFDGDVPCSLIFALRVGCVVGGREERESKVGKTNGRRMYIWIIAGRLSLPRTRRKKGNRWIIVCGVSYSDGRMYMMEDRGEFVKFN